MRRAIEAWKQSKHPHIMLYFNASPCSPKTADEAEQWRLVLEFKSEMSSLGFLGQYAGIDDFIAKVRKHLTMYLEQRIKQDAESQRQEALNGRWYHDGASHSRWIHDALNFFDERLNEAFPGVRGLQIFRGQEAVERLQRLLHDPLKIPDDRGDSAPLWWWHGHSDLEINEFRVLDANKLQCLLGHDELLIHEVAIYRDRSRPYRSFVYISVNADQPTGIREITEADIKDLLEWSGYAAEEVGLWNGRYITREEYDDGYAEIDGKVVEVADAEVRIRYLTPYNLFITSITSVFNSTQVDETMETMCTSLLSGDTKLDEVVTFVDGLELTEHIRDAYFWGA